MAKTFKHGVHPPERKEATNSVAIRQFPFAPYLVILLSQHAGAPAQAIVREGEELYRGKLIARESGFISAPIHSPATGVVKSLSYALDVNGKMAPAIVIEPYPGSRQEIKGKQKIDIDALNPEEIIAQIRNIGMVGLGGAAFPTHVKYKIPEGKAVDTLIINGCECEPYLSADHRVMVEESEDIIIGAKLVARALGVKQIIIAIETNKPDAIRALRAAASQEKNISVQACQTKYPQGAEKMLSKALLGREVPSGGLPLDVGVVVSNIITVAEIAQLLPYGQGLIERVITVTGAGIRKPGNYRIPIGTPLDFILDTLGMKEDAEEVIFGGPMMGKAVTFLETPITKGVSGILVLTKDEVDKGLEERKVLPCIKCASCLQACPISLNPSRLGLLANNHKYDAMADDYHLFDCFECGACSYTCPSNIPLVQLFKVAKGILRKRRKAA